MLRITPLVDGDGDRARSIDDLVITEFGDDSAQIPDGRICICWTSSTGTPSAMDGGRTSR
ncbi:hypothetical protein [Streptomyces sp. 3214.6]|uniref:hypothetical protein n=1 Tax=Streptomyces sp. 3214.6 TaxID=1882757 RepID=UPI000909CB7D|nr:hypothetical protein [Streptomyces sp. 3214.6]SHH96416.1 hypothetical protein SAMN05444521_2899 [Streptomyces sp. 3214.6]